MNIHITDIIKVKQRLQLTERKIINNVLFVQHVTNKLSELEVKDVLRLLQNQRNCQQPQNAVESDWTEK
jgi:hypothetical protein